MRTFPKSLATFRRIVNERGERLRGCSLGELERLSSQPIEHLTVDRRQATIGVIVQPQSSGGLRIVIQGFMEARLIPGKHVAIDGFYKLPDGTVTPMSIKEFYEFD
jgi:hypothetical protein